MSPSVKLLQWGAWSNSSFLAFEGWEVALEGLLRPPSLADAGVASPSTLGLGEACGHPSHGSVPLCLCPPSGSLVPLC